MLDSLLIPLDGSSFSEQTLPFAESVARSAGARVHLAHVHVPHPPEDLLLNPQFQFEGVDMREYEAGYRSEEEEYLEAVAKRFQMDVGMPVTRRLLEGQIRDSLEEYAEETHADLILMSTHGRTGMSRFWLGSVADDLVRHSHLPILLIPPLEGDAPSVDEVSFDHVLVPLDGTVFSESILDRAMEIGSRSEAQYTLLHVVPTHYVVGARSYPIPMGHLEERKNKAREYMCSIGERLRAQGAIVDCKVVDHAAPARAILTMADTLDVDLIALATHGLSNLSRAFLGSVADKVIRASTRPVLVQRPTLGE